MYGRRSKLTQQVDTAKVDEDLRAPAAQRARAECEETEGLSHAVAIPPQVSHSSECARAGKMAMAAALLTHESENNPQANGAQDQQCSEHPARVQPLLQTDGPVRRQNSRNSEEGEQDSKDILGDCAGGVADAAVTRDGTGRLSCIDRFGGTVTTWRILEVVKGGSCGCNVRV
jgi:hypothetical protein